MKAEATRTWGSSTARHRGGDRQPGALSPLNLSPEQAELFEARSRTRSEPSAISFAGGTALGAGTAPAKQPWAVLVGRPTALVVVVEVVGVELREQRLMYRLHTSEGWGSTYDPGDQRLASWALHLGHPIWNCPWGPKAPSQSFSVFNRLLRERLGTELVAYKIAHRASLFSFCDYQAQTTEWAKPFSFCRQ